MRCLYALPLIVCTGCSIISGLDEYRLVVYEPAPTTSTTGAGGAGGMAGTGGMAGAGGSGGAGAAGSGGAGGAPVLDDTGLVARYYIDEAASGQTPTTLLDAETMAGPENLTLNAAGVSAMQFSFVEVAGHHGLQWAVADLDAKVFDVIQNNSHKLRDRLHGKTAATLEAVAQVSATNNFGAPILSMSHKTGGLEERLSLVARVGGGVSGLELQWDGSVALPSTVAGAWDADLSQRRVVHLVLDTALQDAVQRVKLYIDGTEVADRIDSVTLDSTTMMPRSVDEPDGSEQIQITVGNDEEFVLGNKASLGSSIQGTIFYAAIYEVAFDGTRAAQHAAALFADDDTPQ